MLNNEDSIKSKFTESDVVADRTNLISDYVQYNLLSFQYLRNRNVKTAMTTFEKCIELARKLDETKYIESMTNYAICQYFCGKFPECYMTLEEAREISEKLCDNNFNDKMIQCLHLRILCNLSLCALSLNKTAECRDYFDSCIQLIRSQEKLLDRVMMLKELVYIFFRVDNLHSYYDQGKNMFENPNSGTIEQLKSDNLNNEDSMNGRIVSKTLFSLHKTLRENNIEPWMKCLNEEAMKFRSVKDINGYVFIIINQFAANFYLNGKITEKVKTNFTKILKIYAEQYNKDFKLKEKNLHSILSDFKSRIDLSMEIYKKLLDLENEISSELQTLNSMEKEKENEDSLISHKVLIKIFFKHALNYLSKEGDNMQISNAMEIKSQIELALNLLENDEFDFSTINVFNINSEITKSLKTLLENLILIRNKCIIYKNFKKLMRKTLRYEDIKQYMSDRYIKSQLYMESRLDKITEGILKC